MSSSNSASPAIEPRRPSTIAPLHYRHGKQTEHPRTVCIWRQDVCARIVTEAAAGKRSKLPKAENIYRLEKSHIVQTRIPSKTQAAHSPTPHKTTDIRIRAISTHSAKCLPRSRRDARKLLRCLLSTRAAQRASVRLCFLSQRVLIELS